MVARIDFHQKAYVCIHVFGEERPVLLVSRADGDWCLLCGDEHEDDASAYRVVGIGHILERDPSINAVLDLPAEWNAERSAQGQPWQRQSIPDSER
jgi:hypothetical protein